MNLYLDQHGFILSYYISGYIAFNTNQGSSFVQNLRDLIIQHYQEDDLLTMLTDVNHRVTHYKYDKPYYKHLHGRHTVSCIEDMLLKNISFMPHSKANASAVQQVEVMEQ